MQVSVEDVSSVKKILHIEIPSENVIRELDIAYSDVQKNAKIKGFRPGKVPRSVVERMFKKDIHADVSSKLIQESFADAIREKDLKLVGSPKITPPEVEPQQPYRYDAEIEVNPQLEDIDFKGLPLKKTLYEVKDEEVALQVEMLRKNLAKQNKLDEFRPVVEGDLILIDYEGFKDGKPVPEVQKTENFVMKLGTGRIDKSFDEQIIGMKPEESREIAVEFPADHRNPKLAGQTLQFNVILKEIREEILPEVNDEFAKNFGKYQTLEELKEDIRKDMQARYEKRADQEIQEQIFTALIEKKDFEVPDILVDYELDGILAEIEGTFQYHNTSAEQLGLTREHLSAKYRDVAVRQVKRHLILGKIIEQEKIELPDEELQQAYQDMAQNFGQPIDNIREYYRGNPDKLEVLKHTLLEKQAIRLITDSAQITTVDAAEAVTADSSEAPKDQQE